LNALPTLDDVDSCISLVVLYSYF